MNEARVLGPNSSRRRTVARARVSAVEAPAPVWILLSALVALAGCSAPALPDDDAAAGDATPVWDRDGSRRADAATAPDAATPCTRGFCEPVTALAAGYFHACVVRRDGTVACAGSNVQGELGDGSRTSRATFASVPGLARVTQVAAGDRHACALRSDGTVACWGLNFSGQLGDGTRTNRATPAAVPGLSDVVQVASGATFNCALIRDGSVRCWGSNEYGQLGEDYQNRFRITPGGPVAGVEGATQIALGPEHACAVVRGGAVRCWGNNGQRQLGTDVLPAAWEAVAVPGASDAVEVTTGRTHACARRADGGVMCWGVSFHGETGGAGQGAATVAGLAGVAHVAAGQSHTCAALTDGTVRCFGWNGYGQLGDGTTSESARPVAVAGLADVVELGAGAGYTCARRRDGVVRCWGRNEDGQFGDGTTLDRRGPDDATGQPANRFGRDPQGRLPGVGFVPITGTMSVYQCVFGVQCQYPVDLTADPSTVPGSAPGGWNFTGEAHALYRRRYGPGSFGAIPQGMANELYFANAEALRNAFRRGELGGPAEYDGVPTQLETEDAKFTIARGSSWFCANWVAYGEGGSPEMPSVVHDATRPPGPYSASCPVWRRCTCYYDNQP